MPRMKINKANITQIIKPVSGQVDYVDTDLHGFDIRATKDALTFFVRSTLKGTTKRPFIPIGAFGCITAEMARKTAKEYLHRLDIGEDPHPDRQFQLETITLAELYGKYIATKKTLAVTTRYQYDSWLKSCLQDWMKLDVTAITGSMVIDRLNKLESKNGKGQALNAIKLLKSMFTFG